MASVQQQDSTISFADVAEHAQARREEIAALDAARPKGIRSLDGVERELEAVLENIEYGIYFMGPDYKIRLMNSAFRQMWGIEDDFVATEPDFFDTIEYLRKRGTYDVPDDEWPDYVRARFEAVRAADGSQRESRRADGRVFLYKCLPLPDDSRMLVYFDITEQKKSEKKLEQSSRALRDRVHELELLRHELRAQRDEALRHAEESDENREILTEAIENIEEAVLVWDENGELIIFNHQIRNFYPDMADLFQPGVSFDAIIREGFRRGIYLAQGGTDDDLVREWRARHEKPGRTVEVAKFSDGRWMRVSWRSTSRGKRVVTITDITAIKESEATIKAQASRDALTGLANRRAFDRMLAKLAVAAADNDLAPAPVGLLLIDLDRFKDVNDTFGHPAGDAVLKAVAGRLTSCVRKSDLAARIGGDEFAVIVKDVTDLEPVARLADRIVDAMVKPIGVEGGTLSISVSIGGAHCITDRCTVDDLTARADEALYAAKEAGRNTRRLRSELKDGG